MPENAFEGRLALVLDKGLSTEQVAHALAISGLTVRRHRSGDFVVDAPWCDLQLEWDHPPDLLLHGALADPIRDGDRVADALRAAGIAFRGEAYDRSLREVRRWPRT